MDGCCLSLWGETWFEFHIRGLTFKDELELIGELIESILRTSLQGRGHSCEALFVQVVKDALDSVSCENRIMDQLTSTEKLTVGHCCMFEAIVISPFISCWSLVM